MPVADLRKAVGKLLCWNEDLYTFGPQGKMSPDVLPKD